jgi:phosphoribosylaminoimidazole-succinocarboxamide synthase/phosphoribosylformylglycinamidine synthase
MPKPEILDPQGKAVTGALARLGKRFELEFEGEVTEERLAEVRRAAETLLANTVIETFDVRVEPAPASAVEDSDAEVNDAEDNDAEDNAAEENEAESAEEAELTAQAG